MIIDITDERRDYFNARGKIILSACPGSGKTTCLVHKLSILEQECLKNYGKYAGIACLSFTNNAKDEILDKYRKTYGKQLQYPHLVATLDSFINTFITLPFFNLIEYGSLRPKIAENKEQIDRICKVFFTDSSGKPREAFRSELRKFQTFSGTQLARSYAPSSVWIDASGRYTFEGTTPKNVSDADFQLYGAEIMKIKKKHGVILNSDSAYFAFTLLRDIPRIGELLIKRFPFILIDEAQDNSDIQHNIFDIMISAGLTNIEMIGDPYQSLYEWRDASPSLFIDKFNDPQWTGLLLSENRRSVQRIIDCFSRLRTTTDPKISSVDVTDKKLPIIVYKYTDNNHRAILEHFEQKCIDYDLVNSHVVVRGNALKDSMTGNVGEINPWKTNVPLQLLKAIFYFQSGHVRNGVNELRSIITDVEFPKISYNDRHELLEERKNDVSFNSRLLQLYHKLPAVSNSLEDWTGQCITALNDLFFIDASKALTFKTKVNGYVMKDLKKEMVEKYFNKPVSRKKNIPITTVHQVKGSTLDAVLCFFDEKAGRESITFKDFKSTSVFPSEKQRIIYVACSRPQYFLAMAFPTKIKDSDLRLRFGNDIVIHSIPPPAN